MSVDMGGEDAEAWQEMKFLLTQALLDIEVMVNQATEF